MANVYAVKTGNWSDTTVWNTGALPTTADDVYSNTFTITIDQDVTVLSIRNTSATGITAGGTFICSTSRTISCTSAGIVLGAVTVFTFNGGVGVTTTVNALIEGRLNNTNSISAIVHSGAGTLTVVGNIVNNGNLSTSNRNGINFTGTGTLNIIGNLEPGYLSFCLTISGTGSITNITGNVGRFAVGAASNSIDRSISITSVATLNITGNIYGGGGGGQAITISNSSIITITGNVYGGRTDGYGISTSSACRLNIIGGLYASREPSLEIQAVVSTSTSAINIFTGPFLCGNYGMMPFLVARMHLKPTSNSYLLFRDNSTNGALPPGAVASASYLYSPSTVVNGPSPNNVRFGTVYASGSQTGQMRVPLPSQVSLGIPVDNTTGSAVLTGADIANSVWNKLTSEITASNSIGVRLKNVSTPAITGAQLTALG